MEIWRKAAAEDQNEILNKELKLKKVDDEKGIYRFLKEFVLFPVSYPTMLRVALTAKYVFPVVEDHSLALYFRKFYLGEIFGTLKSKVKLTQDMNSYKFAYYKSIILDYTDKICSQMQKAGKSRHLRELGRLLMGGGLLNLSNLRHDISSIDFNNNSMSVLNHSTSNILNNSGFEESLLDDKSTDKIEKPK